MIFVTNTLWNGVKMIFQRGGMVFLKISNLFFSFNFLLACLCVALLTTTKHVWASNKPKGCSNWYFFIYNSTSKELFYNLENVTGSPSPQGGSITSGEKSIITFYNSDEKEGIGANLKLKSDTDVYGTLEFMGLWHGGKCRVVMNVLSNGGILNKAKICGHFDMEECNPSSHAVSITRGGQNGCAEGEITENCSVSVSLK